MPELSNSDKESITTLKKALKSAFPITIPILLGYVPLGIGFGLIMANAGYNALWAFLSGVIIYSGTAQYVSVDFLYHAVQLLEVILIIVVLNSRMMFYGLSFLEKFREMGIRKWYMIFSLTDETYAILCTIKAPEGVDENKFMFSISLLNQSYWVIGGVIGALFGTVLDLNIEGIEFIMTALFVVLCMDQWKKYKTHESFWVGLLCSVVMLLIFGPEGFMIPALLGILITLTIRRRSIEKKLEAEKSKEEKGE